jgi:hypothetical protein
MSKLLKLLGKIMTILLEWFLVAFILFAFLVRTSSVQTYLAKRATTYFSKELKTQVFIDRVSIVFFNKIVLDGVQVNDRNGIPLSKIKSLFVTFKGVNQIKKELRINQVKIERGIFNISHDKHLGKANFDFIVDYFSSSDSTNQDYNFKIQQVALKDVDFKYDDYRREIKTNEIDYDHVNLKHLYLFASNFSFYNGTIKASVNHLSLNERCGLKIRRFSGHLKISNKEILVKELRANTNKSTIYLPKFQMTYNGWHDYFNFDDKVKFNATIEKSLVHLTDIRFFAAPIEGMNQVCEVKGQVSEVLKKLTIENLDLKFGKSSRIKGKVILPDFRNLKLLNYDEFLTYVYITTEDIENFKFPNITGIHPIELNDKLDKFKFFECSDLKIYGTNQKSNLYAKNIKTDIGNAQLLSGLTIKHNTKKDNYEFKNIDTNSRLVHLDSVDLKKIFEFNSIGKLEGNIAIKGDFDFRGNFSISKMNGNLNKVNLNGYNYSNVSLEDFSFKNDVVESKLHIEDPNAILDIEGKVIMRDDYNFDFKSTIEKVNLFETKFSKNIESSIQGDIQFDVNGMSLNTINGDFQSRDFVYVKEGKKLPIKQFVAELDRHKNNDELKIRSSIFDLSLEGHFNFDNLVLQVNNRLEEVFPTIFSKKRISTNQSNVELEYSFRVNDARTFLEIFAPDIKVAKGSKLKGKLTNETISLNLDISRFEYKDMKFKDLTVNGSSRDGQMELELESQRFVYNDSIKLSSLNFYSSGEKNLLNSTLQWESGENESALSMNFSFVNKSRMQLEILPSYFHLNKNRWDIFKSSEIIIDKNYFRFDNIEFKHKNELVLLNGVLSNNSHEYANLIISNFELENASVLLGFPKRIKGTFNADIQLSNPFSNIEASGDALINDLIVGKEKVGTIDLAGRWLNESKAIKLSGNVVYRDNPTFNFKGNYYPFLDKNNMDFDLQFNGTDIQIVNAFVDDEILNDIQGTLLGEMYLKGELFNPQLIGELDLKEGRAKVEMLGVYFGFEGKLISDKYGFYVNNMPVKDQEGKVGSLVATLYHSGYRDWNYDINIDFTEDINSIPGMRIPINRYLLMNTTYNEDDVFYGKAYGKGTVNINGTEDLVYINSTISSEDGTVMNFPMFGIASVQEDKFITFKSKQQNKVQNIKKFDYSGVNFNLELKVNQSSMMKLIFDERLGDEITAHGTGDVSIKIDQTGEIQMNGEYKIKNDGGQRSFYNFVMGPIKQSFVIEENGTITWNGKPYVAFLDLTTYYNVYTSLNEILPVNATSGSQNFQEVKCNMKLTETIEKPKLSFQLELSKSGTGVNDDARAALNRINENSGELNKQFFSLLLYKKFQPLLSSNNSLGSNAVADLFANQLNSFLSDLSKGYKFNVTYNSANLNLTNDPTQTTTSLNKLAMGVTKDFFDGKLLVNGTFGRSSTTNQSMLIGNVNIEYKLNEDGTIRVIAFNETNDFNVSAQLNSRTTQGGGINIQEEFSSLNDFDLYQKLINYFRTEDKKRIIKRRKKGRVPVVLPSSNNSNENQQASH